MKFQNKKEEVSISFHHLRRRRIDSDGNEEAVAFTGAEFQELFRALDAGRSLSIDDEQVNRKIRFRFLAPIDHVEKFDERFISGIYKASYWGHAYDNSMLGKVPADSINLRPFFFLLYLSESGRIYLASQYLGNFGGYTAIRNTVTAALPEGPEIIATSVGLGGVPARNVMAKEVQITYSRKGTSITSANVFGKAGAISFKKKFKDDGFEGDVTQSILAHATKPTREIQKALAELLKANDLIEVNDEDVEDCKIIALVNGKRKTIHMLDETSFATRYPLDVSLNLDGHPEYAPLKAAVIGLLQRQIISTLEDV